MNDREKTATEVTLSFSAAELNTLANALAEKLVETKQYAAGYRESDEPGPQDSCCPAHLAQWEHRRAAHAALIAHEAEIRSLMDRVERAEAQR